MIFLLIDVFYVIIRFLRHRRPVDPAPDSIRPSSRRTAGPASTPRSSCDGTVRNHNYVEKRAASTTYRSMSNKNTLVYQRSQSPGPARPRTKRTLPSPTKRTASSRVTRKSTQASLCVHSSNTRTIICHSLRVKLRVNSTVSRPYANIHEVLRRRYKGVTEVVKDIGLNLSKFRGKSGTKSAHVKNEKTSSLYYKQTWTLYR